MRILLTLDGSGFAEAAIPAAQQLAVMPGAEVHVLAVIEPGATALARIAAGAAQGEFPGAAPWSSPEEAGFELPEAVPVDIELIVEHYLEMVAGQFPRAVVRPAIRVGTHPAAQIIAYAEANEIDLIVMATHGRTGINRLVHGSVAGEVVRAGVAPVTLVQSLAA